MGLLGEGKQDFFNDFRERKNKFRSHMIQATSLSNSLGHRSTTTQESFSNKLPKLSSYCESGLLIFDFKQKKKKESLSTNQNS